MATLALSGCMHSTNQANAFSLVLLQRIELEGALAETSGLVCSATGMLTINDSGNAAALFAIDYQGQIVKRYDIHSANIDWEAVTTIGDTVYIADIGNNKGKRKDLSILAFNTLTEEVDANRLSYASNRTPNANKPYAHNFDAEALTAKDNTLVLFSKSWADYVAKIYQFSFDGALVDLEPVAEFSGLPGVITGADWDSQRQQFVLIGYKSDPFGNFDTFIARVSAKFELMSVQPLDELKQAEGICVDKQGDYWVSQEGSDSAPALLLQYQVEN